jgi:hypothetical protein
VSGKGEATFRGIIGIQGEEGHVITVSHGLPGPEPIRGTADTIGAVVLTVAGCDIPADELPHLRSFEIDPDTATITVTLAPPMAIFLANRIVRAVDIAMEAGEDPPTLEHDGRRWTAAQ